jgi:hypothetical protein
MRDRISEAPICIIDSIGMSKSFFDRPSKKVRRAPISPREWTGRVCLRRSIDEDGAMRCGAAEKVADLLICGVATCSSVHEVALAECRALNAEQVGVTVTGAVVATERTGVEDQRVRFFIPAAAHRYETTNREHSARSRFRRSLFQSIKNRGGSTTEKPERI